MSTLVAQTWDEAVAGADPVWMEPFAPVDLITSAEFVAIAGLTFRQLDHWARCGVLETAGVDHGYGAVDRCRVANPGSGRRRLWTHHEADICQRLVKLQDLVGPQRLAMLADIATRLRMAVGGEPVEISNVDGTISLLVVAP